ncbi:MAG TPA: hypothetical protein VF815_17740 [Myxococcaceae bacterium]|jgi:hypothetical protein
MLVKKTESGYKFVKKKKKIELGLEDEGAAALWELLRRLEPDMSEWSKSSEGTLKIPNTDKRAQHAFLIAAEFSTRRPPADAGAPQSHRIRRLWKELRPNHQKLLQTLATEGELSQLELQKKLGMDDTTFRSCVGGLAKICKRLAVPYPLVMSGYNQQSRTYTVTSSARNTVVALAHTP